MPLCGSPPDPRVFDFPECSLALENPTYAAAKIRGGVPTAVSLPFCGAVVDYPIAKGHAEQHGEEDAKMKALHDTVFGALAGGGGMRSAMQTCAAMVKVELCRTAFSICDVDKATGRVHSTEYCTHSHVAAPPAGGQVSVCARGESSPDAGRAGDMGQRVICAPQWNGLACFDLPAPCEGLLQDLAPGSCPTGPGVWRGMPTGCFTADDTTGTATRYTKRLPASVGGDVAVATVSALLETGGSSSGKGCENEQAGEAQARAPSTEGQTPVPALAPAPAFAPASAPAPAPAPDASVGDESQDPAMSSPMQPSPPSPEPPLAPVPPETPVSPPPPSVPEPDVLAQPPAPDGRVNNASRTVAPHSKSTAISEDYQDYVAAAAEAVEAKEAAHGPEASPMNIFKLSMREAFKARPSKEKDAGGNHAKGGALWSASMEVIAVVSTIAVAWTFLKRFTGAGDPEPGGINSGRGRRRGGYTLVVDGKEKDEGGIDMETLPTSTKPSMKPSLKNPKALVKAGKNMVGAGRGKKS